MNNETVRLKIKLLKKYSLRLAQISQKHPYGHENEFFAIQQELNSKDEDLFDKLCNVLSVFGKNCNDIISTHSDIIDEFFRKQKIPFNAVFDLFERLKIYDIYVAIENENTDKTKNNSNNNKQHHARKGGAEQKEQKEQKRQDNKHVMASFFLQYFAQYVENVQAEESKVRLYRLLTKYKLFINESSKAPTNFYAKISKNQHVLYSPKFVPCIKRIFEKYSDEEMNKWYLHYWNLHGIKNVIDIIYQCGFKFDAFCNVLKEYPNRLQDDRICKFEEWLQLIVIPSCDIPTGTKLIIAQNPPLKFDDIMNIKSEKERNDCFERLKLALVEDDTSRARLLGFGRKLEMPLVKYNQSNICNCILHHLLQDSIPNFKLHGVDQDKKIISFFAGKTGQQMIRFINQLIRIVEGDENENENKNRDGAEVFASALVFCLVFHN